MLARHQASGHDAPWSAPRKSPEENPTNAPIIISFFIFRLSFGRCLAGGLPAQEIVENALFSAKLTGQKGVRRGLMEVSGHILPGAQRANTVICAQNEVPELTPPRLFIQMRHDQVFNSQG